MKLFGLLAALCLVTALSVGCGSNAATPAAKQDEVSKWVEDNPAPEAVEVQAVE